MAFDPWRGQILTAAYDEIRFWLQNGELVRRFRPYEKLSIPPYDKLSIEPYDELSISAFAVNGAPGSSPVRIPPSDGPA